MFNNRMKLLLLFAWNLSLSLGLKEVFSLGPARQKIIEYLGPVETEKLILANKDIAAQREKFRENWMVGLCLMDHPFKEIGTKIILLDFKLHDNFVLAVKRGANDIEFKEIIDLLGNKESDEQVSFAKFLNLLSHIPEPPHGEGWKVGYILILYLIEQEKIADISLMKFKPIPHFNASKLLNELLLFRLELITLFHDIGFYERGDITIEEIRRLRELFSETITQFTYSGVCKPWRYDLSTFSCYKTLERMLG